MPFGEKAFQKQQGVYYPQAVVQGKPVETETIAKDLTKIFTVSNSDVQAVLGDIAGVMHTRMAQGKSVHIKGLGYFRYTLDTKGVKDLADFDKQVQAVRVQFTPERSGCRTRPTPVPLWTAMIWNGLNFLPMRRTMTRRRVAEAQTVPVMAKMVTILWDNVIADKDCYNVCSLWF